MAIQRAVYRPRDAEHAVLHQVVAEHLEAFLGAVAAAGDGAGLPRSPDVCYLRRFVVRSLHAITPTARAGGHGMAFFDVPKDEDLPAASRTLLEEYQRLNGTRDRARSWQIFGHLPKIVEGRFLAWKNLNYESSFSVDARMVAVMLIAHAQHCQFCFAGARFQLDKLGFDEGVMDAMCANPDTLPLKERDRRFVHYVLKIATDSTNLTPKDFREMEQASFSKDEILEMIAFAAYWIMNIVFSQAALAGLVEE
jgi:alkylhydroperoxidase family enzyme